MRNKMLKRVTAVCGGNYDDISGDGAGNKDHTRTGK